MINQIHQVEIETILEHEVRVRMLSSMDLGISAPLWAAKLHTLSLSIILSWSLHSINQFEYPVKRGAI